MTDSNVPPHSFGQLIAEVADLAATRALLREHLAFGEALKGSPDDMTAAFQNGRDRLAEVEQKLAGAIATLDRAIGISPIELARIGAGLDKLSPA